MGTMTVECGEYKNIRKALGMGHRNLVPGPRTTNDTEESMLKPETCRAYMNFRRNPRETSKKQVRKEQRCDWRWGLDKSAGMGVLMWVEWDHL